jgi:YD repeat-containing protein
MMTKPTLFIALLFLLGLGLAAWPASSPAPTQVNPSECDVTGRQYQFTPLGNLIGFQTPTGYEHLALGGVAREGYIISYDDPTTEVTRLVYDLGDRRSTVFSSSGDFIPLSLDPLPPYRTLDVGNSFTLKAVVQTRDALLRLTHTFTVRGGIGEVVVGMEVRNNSSSRSIFLRSVKRHANINKDAGGSYGNGNRMSDATSDGATALFYTREPCPPPPPPPELPRGHTVTMTGDRVQTLGLAVSARPIVKPFAGTPSEALLSSCGSSPTLPRRDEDSEVTMCWPISRTLLPGSSLTFTTTYRAY